MLKVQTWKTMCKWHFYVSISEGFSRILVAEFLLVIADAFLLSSNHSTFAEVK